MASTASNTVLLKGDPMVKEAPAAAAIKPGYLVFRNSSNKFAKHATAGGFCPPFFALEKAFLGYEDNPTIDTQYAADDQVAAAVCRAGDEVYALLAAAAPAVAIGDLLESAGDGTLRKVVNLTHAVGTADGTVADVGGAFNQGTLNDNFKELTTYLANGAGKTAIARALEAVDNSGGGTEARLRVEII